MTFSMESTITAADLIIAAELRYSRPNPTATQLELGSFEITFYEDDNVVDEDSYYMDENLDIFIVSTPAGKFHLGNAETSTVDDIDFAFEKLREKLDEIL